MKAVTLAAPDRVVVVDDWPEPSCGPDEVIVAVRGVGVCGSDLSVISGRRQVPSLPWVLGHEAFGEIVRVGTGVTDRRPGQRVVVEPNYPCLACAACASGVTSGCTGRRIVGISEPGLLAERVAVPGRFAWPVPGDRAETDVVCIEPLAVALNAVRTGGLAPGRTCLILGAGAQGLLVCLAALHLGAVPYVTDPQPGRVDFARRLGAGDASTPDAPARYGVVIETSGAPAAFEEALDRTAPGGSVVVVGQSTTPARVKTFTLVQRRLTVRGCLIYDHPTGFAETIAALDGLRPGRVLRDPFALTDAPKAFALAADIPGKSWISLPRPEESTQ